ncbi:RagB/SusD family nutrient uptake outer membrane protein [Reichenbachiella ulvae]|uniref:RagB/SusD family nutrient uptake outer membrane protein n=1 Tax=Reichenbachiella ulvae TaxID=2980104 RepID=A0ABT3CZY9_9BACT|nr:RagB/SusD family nutrient uptake outer membrane protein [Reichenbachiella ulvae]MCV9389192.1 RagB/SusD family nutrient uptake outer membrane protein [Reichenbachiella ulvae]
MVLITPLVIGLTSCNDEFLDTSNKFGSNTDTFYKTKADFDAALGGVYYSLYLEGGNVFGEEHITSMLLSDLMLGGGGPDDQGAKNVDAFTDPNDDTYRDLWRETYNGIFRANNVIEKIVEADLSEDFSSAAEQESYKNQVLGEMYFMRGFLLFRAAKFFGGMPLMVSSTTPIDVPRASFTETFGQIASDFQQGIELLPEIDPAAIPAEDYGHANHWIAQAYLARVYLFYTGYMTNIEEQSTDALTLPDGGTITRQDVIDELTDCVQNSGYALVSDFRNLWPYSYMNQQAGSVVYPWADTENLSWAGQDGFGSTIGTGNSEVMFSLRYSFADWSWVKGQRTTNRACLFFALRGNSGLTPFGEGWGWGPVHTSFFNSWDNADERKLGSVLQVGLAAEGTDGYQGDKGDHETGLFNKKYIHLEYDGGSGMQGLFNHIYSWPNTDMQLRHAQDFYYMRFADVLLMLSELTEDATYMNQVRNRAGLADIAYSPEALKQERMYELAFEGLRWFDLVRWGDVNNASMNYFDNEIDVRNSGSATTYSVTYRPETKGLVSIPESEIRLSDGLYEQNPGW